VLQHIGCEPPAAYEDELLEHGLSIERLCLHDGDPLPEDHSPYSAIIAMGGPMGTYDTALFPWLEPEMKLIADAVRADMPFWGVCLGAQLLAASLGTEVIPGPQPEVGVQPVHLTAAAAGDPVFSLAPTTFPAFHWHGDTYALPPGAVHLARSHSYEQQAFAFRNAYAVQFHLEVSSALVREWGEVASYAPSLAQIPSSDPIAELSSQVAAVESVTVPLARELFSRWLTDVVAPAEAAASAR
jgi:GMP synthase (glutamine-hydrolysing)